MWKWEGESAGAGDATADGAATAATVATRHAAAATTIRTADRKGIATTADSAAAHVPAQGTPAPSRSGREGAPGAVVARASVLDQPDAGLAGRGIEPVGG